MAGSPGAESRGALRAHWDLVHAEGVAAKSWFQASADQSLRILDELGMGPECSVLDVGGGASTFVDGLLARGHVDLSVLDISRVALDLARDRLVDAGTAPERVDQISWLVTDVLTWVPPRTYAVWHDRAAAHFFTTDGERTAYRRVLDLATAPGSIVVLASFAPDGPPSCSGLPVVRADVDALAGLVGEGFSLVLGRPETHRTPSDAEQAFLWTVWRKLG